METQIFIFRLERQKDKCRFDLPGYHIRLQLLYRAGQVFQQKWALPSINMRCCSGRKLQGVGRGGKCLGKSQEEYLLTVDHIWNLARSMPLATSWISTENCQASSLTILMLPHDKQSSPGKPHQNRTRLTQKHTHTQNPQPKKKPQNPSQH